MENSVDPLFKFRCRVCSGFSDAKAESEVEGERSGDLDQCKEGGRQIHGNLTAL